MTAGRFPGLSRIHALPRTRRLAALAGIAWAILVVGYAAGFLSRSADALGRGMAFLDGMLLLVALALPLVLIWLVARLAEELERQRAVIAALGELTPPLFAALEGTRAALDRHAPVSPQEIRTAVQAALLTTRGPDLTGRLDRLMAGQAEIAGALGMLARRPSAPVAPEKPTRACAPRAESANGGGPEPTLPPEPAPVSGLGWPELIRALDFPRDAGDSEGFRALEAALRHQSLALMLQAAEDVLNLLAQEGVYVDDLATDQVDPPAWRRFVAGERGAAVAGVGGIREPRALDAARRLVKSDPIFRDTGLFFQRRFDAVLSEVADGATDAQIAELAGTRCGRAFMLLVRLSGSVG